MRTLVKTVKVKVYMPADDVAPNEEIKGWFEENLQNQLAGVGFTVTEISKGRIEEHPR